MRTVAPAFLFFLAFAVLLQILGGAFTADFGGSPDEPAHYVTGLMVRDYLATLPWPSPMPFAENFYRHYPIVAIGHWPPMFYGVQAVWTLGFGTSKESILLLIAVLAAAVAAVLFILWRPRIGALGAGALALGFLAAPVVQQHVRMVMAEMLLVLLVMLAAVAYKRYLDTEGWRDAVAFGVLSSAAILTKPNGLALALLPMFAVIAMRRLELLKRSSFWLPAVIVIALCGPWYVLTFHLAREGWSTSYSPSWLIRQPALVNGQFLARLIGLPVFGLAVSGMLYELWPRRSRVVGTDAAVMAALIASVWTFHSFIAPVRDPRHLIPAIPPLLHFSAVAILAVGARAGVGADAGRRIVTVAASGLAVLLVVAGLRAHTKPYVGADTAVDEFLRPSSGSSVVLVSSEGYGEGVFIAELASREQRPGHRVVRATKVLSESNWDRSRYRLLYSSPEDADRVLAQEGVTFIVLDVGGESTRPAVPHHRQLLALTDNPARWRKLQSERRSQFHVYQAVGR